MRNAIGDVSAAADTRSSAVDLELARRVRLDLLPASVAGTEAFRVDAHHSAGGGAGGAFYEMKAMDHGRLALFVAQLPGGGVSAALYGMVFKDLLRRHTARCGDPAGLLSHLNRELLRYAAAEQMPTALCAVADPVQNTVRFCGAGHPPLLVYRGASGRVARIAPGGLPLGCLDEEPYRARELRLGRGDLVLFHAGCPDQARLASLLREEVLDPSSDLPKRICDRLPAMRRAAGDRLLITLRLR